jgi:hypothetical protein
MHAGEADPEELEDVLRTALRDATVRVGYLHPGGAEVTDVSGSAIGTAGLDSVAVELHITSTKTRGVTSPWSPDEHGD